MTKCLVALCTLCTLIPPICSYSIIPFTVHVLQCINTCKYSMQCSHSAHNIRRMWSPASLSYGIYSATIQKAAIGSSSMALPTLPLIGVVPSIVFFQTLEWLALSLLWALLLAAVVPPGVLLHWQVRKHQSSTGRIPKQRRLNSFHRCMRTLFLVVGRQLCLQTFPALFKMHKTRSGPGSQTRECMVFLDRKVGNTNVLIAAFWSIVCSILCSSTKVFLRYFPVEESTECLETDNHGRTLFCYSNSSLPVDCANFSVTELRELKFQCYAIALPVGLGIAVAAAFGLAEVGIVGVTIFVKVTEGFFNKIKRRLLVNHSLTTNSPQNQPHCCGCCKLSHANEICIHSSIVLIMIVFITSSFCAIYTLMNVPEAERKHPLHILYYFVYLFYPC